MKRIIFTLMLVLGTLFAGCMTEDEDGVDVEKSITVTINWNNIEAITATELNLALREYSQEITNAYDAHDELEGLVEIALGVDATETNIENSMNYVLGQIETSSSSAILSGLAELAPSVVLDTTAGTLKLENLATAVSAAGGITYIMSYQASVIAQQVVTKGSTGAAIITATVNTSKLYDLVLYEDTNADLDLGSSDIRYQINLNEDDLITALAVSGTLEIDAYLNATE